MATVSPVLVWVAFFVITMVVAFVTVLMSVPVGMPVPVSVALTSAEVKLAVAETRPAALFVIEASVTVRDVAPEVPGHMTTTIAEPASLGVPVVLMPQRLAFALPHAGA